MKGGAATLITVFNELAKNLPYPIGLSLTTDEETGGFNGAGRQVAEGVRADFVISGESGPGFTIGNEHKGVIILDLSTKAQGGHTAYDGNEANAMQRMIDFLKRANEMYPGPSAAWKTSSSVTQVGTENHAHNVVPSDASAQLAMRWIPQDDPDRIRSRIREIDPRVEVTKEVFGNAHQTSRQHPDVQLLAHAIRQVTGRRAGFDRKAGASDVRHWTEVGSGGVDFGPLGNGKHTEDEYVEIASLETYAQILTAFLTSIQ